MSLRNGHAMAGKLTRLDRAVDGRSIVGFKGNFDAQVSAAEANVVSFMLRWRMENVHVPAFREAKMRLLLIALVVVDGICIGSQYRRLGEQKCQLEWISLVWSTHKHLIEPSQARPVVGCSVCSAARGQAFASIGRSGTTVATSTCCVFAWYYEYRVNGYHVKHNCIAC